MTSNFSMFNIFKLSNNVREIKSRTCNSLLSIHICHLHERKQPFQTQPCSLSWRELSLRKRKKRKPNVQKCITHDEIGWPFRNKFFSCDEVTLAFSNWKNDPHFTCHAMECNNGEKILIPDMKSQKKEVKLWILLHLFQLVWYGS